MNPAQELFGDQQDDDHQQNYIHIRNQQRNGRKSLTIIQGLPKQFSSKKILKHFKKVAEERGAVPRSAQTFSQEFNCNGSITEDPEFGKVIMIQGDKRKLVGDFLVHEGIAEKDFVKASL
ncbi:Eukaryotic translation initiation factor, putative [Perkinsus marinus ATCC 50983]|uniref:Eukaryotic translation initiation factor, putative n=1 Tax=Perkinsus marinus (strain ATCC 50983 / TXsc) TaxID=423536 RepID=C5KPQ1_PERM5|nr:Eukaryotic translation initiation factor, putative [Perkinsus marinus ATCC 50983]EER13448.1 Eukaryotic translation initiation factor, putative [Perkinsus marinus ATCC 50983]|eukprot:XP_002781653.1 Eukaryotic translation initiation factor, putative [Perkinsus marinus ATCC 50983]